MMFPNVPSWGSEIMGDRIASQQKTCQIKRQRQDNCAKAYTEAVEFHTNQWIEVIAQSPPTSPMRVSGWHYLPGCLALTLLLYGVWKHVWQP